MASDKDRDFSSLRDGQRLHATHLFQLADYGAQAAARSATAAAGAGFFDPGSLLSSSAPRTWQGSASKTAPTPPDPNQPVAKSAPAPLNSITVDAQAGRVQIANLALLSAAGFPLLLPPPAKTVDLPRWSGKASYLNVHGTSLSEGSGRNDVSLRWEEQPGSGPRSAPLLQRVNDGVVVLPMPLTLAGCAQTRVLLRDLQVAGGALRESLIEIEQDGLGRLRLSVPQRPFLDPLFGALERVLRCDERTPTSVVLAELEGLAEELCGWMQYINAASGGQLHGLVMPDAIGRRQLHRRRGPAALPEALAGLDFPVTNTTQLLDTLTALHGALISFTRLVQGESDELLLEPIGSYEPWAGAIGFLYAVDAYVGRSIALRCEAFAQYEPQLLCGLGKVGSQPNLRHSAMEPSGEGRFEALLDAFQPEQGDQLIVVLGTRDARVRVFLRRAV